MSLIEVSFWKQVTISLSLSLRTTLKDAEQVISHRLDTKQCILIVGSGVLEETWEVYSSGRQDSQGSPVGWATRNWKDPVGKGHCRRGWSSILLHLRVRVRGDVCWCGCISCPWPFQEGETGFHQHSSDPLFLVVQAQAFLCISSVHTVQFLFMKAACWF